MMHNQTPQGQLAEPSALGMAVKAGTQTPSISDLLFRSLTRWRISMMTQLLDMIIIVNLALVVFPSAEETNHVIKFNYLFGAVVVSVVSHFSFFQGRLYEIDTLMDPARAFKSLSIRWTVVFLMVAALTALVHEPNLYSRFWFAGFYAGGILALGAERWLIAKLIRAWIRRGHHSLSVAIVGGNELTEKLIAKFKGNSLGIQIIGVFDDRNRENVRHISGVRMLGTVADLLEYSRTHEVDTVVLTLPLTASQRIQAVIRQLRQQPLNIRVLPGSIGLERISPIRLARTELPGVQLISVADRPISEFALLIKGVFDRVAAAMLMLMVSPVLLICAVGVAVNSNGPILFTQKRVGYKGREFDILKFRTMHVADRPNTELTRRDDPRVFKFGSLLRKLSLDELPQLFNVLKGDMSLVGPRPHMPEAKAAGKLYFDVVDEYADRQRVKPGITGWAQVNGWRGPTETVEQIERRVEHDIYYIENWSLMLDLIVLMKTVMIGFYGKNAF